MASRHQIRYSRLATDEDDDYDTDGRRQNDPRFGYSPKSYDRIPWKSIALAVFLLLIGCLLLLLSVFIFTGHMAGELSQAYSLLGLGILAFLPGMPKMFLRLELHTIPGEASKVIPLLLFLITEAPALQIGSDKVCCNSVF